MKFHFDAAQDMTDLDKLLAPSIFIQPSNGKHAITAPPATGEPIALPEDYWKGCDVDGLPRDPAHPWHWSTRRGDA